MKLHLPKGYLSASQISSWKWNKGQYVDRYIFGVLQQETPEMAFGKKIAELLEHNDASLKHIPRGTHPEHELKTTFTFKDCEFDFLGYIDSWDPETNTILEYKTGRVAWSQDKANAHLQTLLYALITYQQTHVIPKVKIIWLPTKLVHDEIVFTGGKYQTFPVKITLPKLMDALAQAKKTALEIHTFYTQYEKTATELAADFPMEGKLV